MSGTLLEDWVPTALSSDYINRAIHFEKEQEFLEITLTPKPGMALSTWFAVRHDHGHAMQWQAVLRPAPDGSGVMVLYHDFSDVYPPSVPTSPNSGSKKGWTDPTFTSQCSRRSAALSCCGSVALRSGWNGNMRT